MTIRAIERFGTILFLSSCVLINSWANRHFPKKKTDPQLQKILFCKSNINVCSPWSFVRTHVVPEIMLSIFLIALNVKRNSAFLKKKNNKCLFTLILHKNTLSNKYYVDLFDCSQWEKKFSLFIQKENRFLFTLILHKVKWTHKDYVDKVFYCS